MEHRVLKSYLLSPPWTVNCQQDFYPDYEIDWLEATDIGELAASFLRDWRRELKEKLDWVFGAIRPRICMVCHQPFGAWDMHEGVVSRNDVRGWKKPLRLLIMSEVNCIPLHHACHMDRPPTREDVWAYQMCFYGEQVLYGWYTRLPWKADPPRRFW